MDLDAIPATPLDPEWTTGKASHRLVQSEDSLVLKQMIRTELVLIVFALAVGWGVSRYFVSDGGPWPMRLFGHAWLGFSLFLALLFGLFAAVRLKYGMRATFDLVRGELRVTGRRFPGGLTIGLCDIVALQVVSGKPVTSSEGPSWRPYELNLAWRKGGEIARVCLLCHGDVAALRRQADRIAGRLNVPVLDHHDGKSDGH